VTIIAICVSPRVFVFVGITLHITGKFKDLAKMTTSTHTFRRSRNRDNITLLSDAENECQYEDYSTDDGLSLDDSKEVQLQLSTKHQTKDQIEQLQFSQKETKSVRQLRIWMIVILCSSAITAGVLSYWYLRRTEYAKFQSMFHDDASKLGQSLYGGVINAFATMDLLSTVMVTHARSANETWPLTTLPYYGNIVSKMLSMSVAINVWTVMLVDGNEQRSQWEEYAWNHRSFVNETLAIMESDPTYFGDIPWNVPMKPNLHDDNNPLPYNES
jgi:hypothetical protein